MERQQGDRTNPYIQEIPKRKSGDRPPKSTERRNMHTTHTHIRREGTESRRVGQSITASIHQTADERELEGKVDVKNNLGRAGLHAQNGPNTNVPLPRGFQVNLLVAVPQRKPRLNSVDWHLEDVD